jgi:hypothetical protein
MNYWIISVSRNGFAYYDMEDLFASPYQADVYLRTKVHRDLSYTVRPATWQEREERMFSAEVYQRPVWHKEAFWKEWGASLHQHFVHISLADPSTIAFTEDARKGEADRQTLMKPGKYLQKFLGDSGDGTIGDGPLKGEEPKITKQQVAYYAAWHKAGERPPNDDELHFTADAAEMIRVYRTGPYSCMRGCDKDWPDRDHPVQVYAAGDLQMAYMTRPDGTVAGRGLCWPEKQVFGRVYPTPNTNESQKDYDELHARLKALGWTSINERQSVFEGARLRYMTTACGEVMMPYLDHSYGVEETYDGGKRGWRMTHDEHHQDRTDGILNSGDDEDDDSWQCDHCGDNQPEYDERYAVYGYWRRPNSGRYGYPSGEESWCESCQCDDAFYCEGTNEYYADQGDNYVEVGYERYQREWFFANDGYQCSWTEDYFFKRDDPPITLASGEVVSPDALKDAAFQCLYDGQWWSKDWESDVVPGYSAAYDNWPRHPVEAEFTFPDMPVDPEDVEAWAKAHVVPRIASSTYPIIVHDDGSIEPGHTPYVVRMIHPAEVSAVA